MQLSLALGFALAATTAQGVGNCQKLIHPKEASQRLSFDLNTSTVFSTEAMCDQGRYAVVLPGTHQGGDAIGQLLLVDLEKQALIPLDLNPSVPLGSIHSVLSAGSDDPPMYTLAKGENAFLYRLSEVVAEVVTSAGGPLHQVLIDKEWIIVLGEHGGAAAESGGSLYKFFYSYQSPQHVLKTLKALRLLHGSMPLDLAAIGETASVSNTDPARVYTLKAHSYDLRTRDQVVDRVDALRRAIPGGEPASVSKEAYAALVASCILSSDAINRDLAQLGFPQDGRVYLGCDSPD